MQAQWLANLKDPDRSNLEELILGNTKVLDRLSEICYNMLKSGDASKDDYDSPSWAYKQADKLGYQRALKQIILLCKVNKESHDK